MKLADQPWSICAGRLDPREIVGAGERETIANVVASVPVIELRHAVGINLMFPLACEPNRNNRHNFPLFPLPMPFLYGFSPATDKLNLVSIRKLRMRNYRFPSKSGLPLTEIRTFLLFIGLAEQSSLSILVLARVFRSTGSCLTTWWRRNNTKIQIRNCLDSAAGGWPSHGHFLISFTAAEQAPSSNSSASQ